MDFDAVVWDAAGHPPVQLRDALTLHGNLIDAPNPREGNSTPLSHAAERGQTNAVETLLRLGSKAIDTSDDLGRTPMHAAASQGHVAVIELLVRKGSRSIDSVSEQGWTPMHYAAMHGHLEVIDALVRSGSRSIDATDSRGRAPIHLASVKGLPEVIETLVRLGSRAVDLPDSDGLTPIHLAAENGRASGIKTLVRLGCKSTDAPDRAGKTPLHLAAERGHVVAIEALVQCGSQAVDVPSSDGWLPLQSAAEKGHVRAIETLVQLRSQAIDTADPRGWTPAYSAAQRGDVHVVEALVRVGSGVLGTCDAKGRTIVHCAAQNGHVTAIETFHVLRKDDEDDETILFIDCPDYKGMTPLYVAVQSGCEAAVVEALVRLGSRAIDTPDEDGKTPMHVAAANGNVDIIGSLIRLGSRSIDSPDQRGRTPMRAAAFNGKVSAVEALVLHGSLALDTIDSDGWTPLSSAIQFGHVAVIEALVRLGSKAIDTPNKKGETPMHAAARSGRAPVIEALVAMGSTSIDSPDRAGCTPMHLAVQNGHTAAIETLVRLKSRSIDAANHQGCTPMHLAAMRGHAAAVEMLVRKGSRAADTPDYTGCSPLAIAIRKNDLKMIAPLISAGGDLALGLQTKSHCDALIAASTSNCCSQLTDWTSALQLARYYNPEGRVMSLKGADFSNQSAAALPLSNWRWCATLDLSGNPNVTEIPMSLAVLDPTLTLKITFEVTSKWSTLDANIAQSEDARSIIEFARLKTDGGYVPVNERKLMAVGFAAVGKTTLIRRLKDESYSQPVSTDGVDMGELTLQSDAGKTMRVVVWDFAGQPLYRQTHLLFLRNPGLCLLLFKLTDEVNKCVEQLRYWCETLRSLTAGSRYEPARMLLVGTHLDRCVDRSQAQHHADQVCQRLQEFLPSIEQPVLVSCAEGAENKQTIVNLRAEILRISQSMRILAPACIETVRNALLPLGDTSKSLLTIAEAHDLVIRHAQASHSRLCSDDQLREACLRALVQLGSMLAVEERGGRITHVVTNPQWVAQLVASVVTTRHTWVARGRVTLSTLKKQIWRGNPRFPVETHDVLVTILEQLKIMFAVDKRQGEAYPPSQVFFIPSSLPEHRPHPRFATSSNANVNAIVDYSVSSAAEEEEQQHKTMVQLRRLFKLTETGRSVPAGVVPEILAQMMALPHTKLLVVWQQGGDFQIRAAAGTVTVSVCKACATAIRLVIEAQQAQLASEWVRLLSTMVKNQLADVYHMPFEVRLPCTLADDSCYVQLDDLLACVLQRRQARCRPWSAHSSTVEFLAPDLLFADLGCQSFLHRWSAVELLERLGTGSYGNVMRGRLSVSTMAYTFEAIAIKLLRLKATDDNNNENGNGNDNCMIKNYQEFQQEAYLMSMLEHPNIVRFVGVCLPSEEPQQEHEHGPGLLMEVVGGGTLFESLTDSVGLVKVCRMAVEVMETIGTFETRMDMHLANPDRNERPEALLPLRQLCDEATPRIDRVFAERVFPHDNEAEDDALIAQLRELHHLLTAQLQLLYAGPITAALHQQTDHLIDQLRTLAPVANELLVPIDWPLRLKLATDAAQGLMYMHSIIPALVHRDFKSPNVLLTQRLDTVNTSTIDWRRPLAKVGDFGLSVRMLATNELQASAKLATSSISPTWAAPEVLSQRSYSTEADVYGMGIMLWELLLRAHPFLDTHLFSIAKHVIEGGRPSLPSTLLADSDGDDVMREYLSLMQQCWHQSAEQRPLIAEVYCRLRELSRRVAPEVFATLPEKAKEKEKEIAFHSSDDDAQPKRPATQRTAAVESIDVIERVALDVEGIAKVQCMQAVGDNTVWIGLNTGAVLHFEFAADSATTAHAAMVCCSAADQHIKRVAALSFNRAQQHTVWSGSEDGRIFVWSAEIEGFAAAKERCYLKNAFTVAASNVRQLVEGRDLHFVLRNGWLHCFPDEHVGPPCFELDLCRVDIVATVHQSGHLELVTSMVRLVLLPTKTTTTTTNSSSTFADSSEDSPVYGWQRTISNLTQLNSTKRGLSRLAVSPKRHTRVYITALEATDDATWCLSLDSLVEWHLLETQHGLHGHLRLEPGRQLSFDMNSAQLAAARLRNFCGLAWVAPQVLWVGAAKTVAFIDLTPAAIAEPPKSIDALPSSPLPPPSSSLEIDTLASSSSSSSSTPASSPLRRASDYPACAVCNKSFSVFRWRHPCPGCGVPLCSKCLETDGLCRECTMAPQKQPSAQPASEAVISVVQAAAAPALTLQWPSTPPQHSDAIQHLVLVESSVSPSGFEVWTYVAGEDILIWRTPLLLPTNTDTALIESPQDLHPLCPVLIGRAHIEDAASELTCMRQVGNQVWAGTNEGTIVGWDIATRAPLAQPPLPTAFQHAKQPGMPRPTSDIASFVVKRRTVMAVSSGLEPTLRKFTLQSETTVQTAAASSSPTATTSLS